MKICPQCNKDNEDFANNCTECGYSFNQNVNFNNPEQYQNPNQQYNNYQQQNIPRNKKSKLVGLILNMLVVGLGYAYVGKWGEGIVLLVIYAIMFALGFVLLFPFVIALALWVYSLIKTNRMIDNYNAGLPY